MARILLGTALVWLAVLAPHVAAQAPGSTAASVVARPMPARVPTPRMLPGTRPGVFTTIQGNALTSTNGALSNAFVRLRDARTGRIIETQVTDNSGLFEFRSVDPGSYIVEIVGQDQTSVLAASQLLNAGAGEIVSTVVKLPFLDSPFAGILGHSRLSAATVALQAAATGILAAQVSGAPTCQNLR